MIAHKHVFVFNNYDRSSKTLMRKKRLQFALRYLHESVDDWKMSCRLMNLPFSASLATNKGYLGAIIDT